MLSELGDGQHEHYFVEFGATDGVLLSNTHLLETRLGWNGILAEPARVWQDRLKQNRTCCIDFKCVASEDAGQLEFVEPGSPEHSGIVKYADNGEVHSCGRMYSQNVDMVDTVSLDNLLGDYGSPLQISCLSMDTEGSELAILESLD